jgi:hypothetical protein
LNGDYKDDQPHGKGRLKYPPAHKIDEEEGEFKHGILISGTRKMKDGMVIKVNDLKKDPKQ